MSEIVTPRLPGRRRVHRLALAGCPGIATLRDPVAIASTLTTQEVAGAWHA